MKTQLETNNSLCVSAKTELDNALTNSLITQTQHDTYYPMLDNIISNNNLIIAELNKNVGHKSVGNYGNINDMITNPSKTKDEITRSITKYKPLTDCAPDIIGSTNGLDSLLDAFSNLPTIDFMINYQSIINWLDLNNSSYSSFINSMVTSITDFVNNITNMKNNVKTYINNIVTVAGNVVSAMLPDNSPCATSIGNVLLNEKSVDDLNFINSLKTDDITTVINNKIKSIQI